MFNPICIISSIQIISKEEKVIIDTTRILFYREARMLFIITVILKLIFFDPFQNFILIFFFKRTQFNNLL